MVNLSFDSKLKSTTTKTYNHSVFMSDGSFQTKFVSQNENNRFVEDFFCFDYLFKLIANKFKINKLRLQFIEFELNIMKVVLILKLLSMLTIRVIRDSRIVNDDL